jgi:predicted transcriptional regulator
MAVRLPGELRQRLKVYAAKTDSRIQAVLAAALDEYLKKRNA